MAEPTLSMIYWGCVLLVAGIVTIYIALAGRR